MKITTSKIFSLDWRDGAKGALMAAGTGALTAIQQAMSATVSKIDWEMVGMAAVGGLVTYLLKNFFSPSKVVIKQGSQALPDFNLNVPPPPKLTPTDDEHSN